MFQIFQPIIDFVQFIVNSILNLILMVGVAVSFMMGLIGLIPVQIQAVFIALVIVCVLFKILGRENQS